MRCSKCAGPHDYRQHDRYCDTCKKWKGHLCLPKCFNCHGPHFANSKDCVFYLNRSSKERQVQLRDEFSQKWKEEVAALKAAANSDSGRAVRTTAAIENKKAEMKGKGKPSAKWPGKDDDDFVPVGKKGKAAYTFGGMVQALASTTRIDTVGDLKDGSDSDASSDLRLSYLDDIPLKQRFPSLKPPTVAPIRTTASTTTPTVHNEPPAISSATHPLDARPKPLTITLPPSKDHRPTRSVSDILQNLKNPTINPEAANTIRFGGGEVAYSASALQAEAAEFVKALAEAEIPSQPSPPLAPDAPNDSASLASATISHMNNQPS
ncbi:hypothetical protein AX14_009702 [Amanita brunnescens Koide BX004]|nr:hypothetical protein AX14_009702 [Amanita brunnescens Koide BX004]